MEEIHSGEQRPIEGNECRSNERHSKGSFGAAEQITEVRLESAEESEHKEEYHIARYIWQHELDRIKDHKEQPG